MHTKREKVTFQRRKQCEEFNTFLPANPLLLILIQITPITNKPTLITKTHQNLSSQTPSSSTSPDSYKHTYKN